MDFTEQKLQENLTQQVQKEENLISEDISDQVQDHKLQSAENISAQNKEMSQNLNDFLTEEEQIEAQPLSKQQKYQQYLASGKLKEIATQSNDYHKKSTRERKYKNFMKKQKKLAKMKDDFKTSEKKAEEITGLTAEQKDSYYNKRFEKELEMLDIKLDAKLEKAKAMAMDKEDEAWRTHYEKMKIHDAKLALCEKYISSGNLSQEKVESIDKALVLLEAEKVKFNDVRALANYKQELAPKDMLRDNKTMIDSDEGQKYIPDVEDIVRDSYQQIKMHLVHKYGYEEQDSNQWKQYDKKPVSGEVLSVLESYSKYIGETVSFSINLIGLDATTLINKEALEDVSKISNDLRDKIALAKRANLTLIEKYFIKSLEYQLDEGELQGYKRQAISRFQSHSRISKATIEDAKGPINIDFHTKYSKSDAQIEEIARKGSTKEKLELLLENQITLTARNDNLSDLFLVGKFDLTEKEFRKHFGDELTDYSKLEKIDSLLGYHVFSSMEEENEFYELYQDTRFKVEYALLEKIKTEIGSPKENEDQLEEKDRSVLRQVKDFTKISEKLDVCKTNIENAQRNKDLENERKAKEKAEKLQKQFDDMKRTLAPTFDKLLDIYMSEEYSNVLNIKRMRMGTGSLTRFLCGTPEYLNSELSKTEDELTLCVNMDNSDYSNCIIINASEEKKQQYQEFLIGKLKEMQMSDAMIETFQK